MMIHMKNKLTDLNDHLFAQLERLSDEDIKGEELDEAIKRGSAIAEIAEQVISSNTLQLKAVSMAYDMGLNAKPVALLQIVGDENSGEAPLH